MFGHDVKFIIIVNMSVRTYGKADNLNHSIFFLQNIKPFIYYECQHSLVCGLGSVCLRKKLRFCPLLKGLTKLFNLLGCSPVSGREVKVLSTSKGLYVWS